jgi:DNA-binding response OmpR family regulator
MGLKVLVIDDDLPVCMGTVEMLQAMGHEAMWAPDTQRALRLAACRPFDVVVTNVVIPGECGYDAILRLKHKQPGVRIVAVAGRADCDPDTMMSVALRIGADHALPRSFTFGQLRIAVTVEAGMPQTGLAAPAPSPSRREDGAQVIIGEPPKGANYA